MGTWLEKYLTEEVPQGPLLGSWVHVFFFFGGVVSQIGSQGWNNS